MADIYRMSSMIYEEGDAMSVETSESMEITAGDVLEAIVPAAPGTTVQEPDPSPEGAQEPAQAAVDPKPKAARKYFHIPFDTMTCPVTHDVHGSIPGVKRRVLKKWGQEKYDSIDWPPLRTYAGLYATLITWNDAQLDELADFLGEPRDTSIEDLAQKALLRSEE